MISVSVTPGTSAVGASGDAAAGVSAAGVTSSSSSPQATATKASRATAPARIQRARGLRITLPPCVVVLRFHEGRAKMALSESPPSVVRAVKALCRNLSRARPRSRGPTGPSDAGEGTRGPGAREPPPHVQRLPCPADAPSKEVADEPGESPRKSDYRKDQRGAEDDSSQSLGITDNLLRDYASDLGGQVAYQFALEGQVERAKDRPEDGRQSPYDDSNEKVDGGQQVHAARTDEGLD